MFKVRFGLIGTNFITDRLLEAATQDPRFEVCAIYSRKQETGEAFAKKHKIPHIFTNLEKMAQSPVIDAVYIASPNIAHAQQSILLMQYGKHVLCEKPMASNAIEVQQMIKAAKENKVLLMEAMKSTPTPNFRTIKEHLNTIGAIRRYFASYCQYSSRYDKLKEGIILNAFKPELSNGATMDIGVYTIYPMVALFGRPNKIDASGFKLSTGVDAQAAVNFEYNDMSATILYSKIADSYLPSEIQGENGSILIERIPTMSNISIVHRNGQTTELPQHPERSECYYEVVEFLNLLEAGKRESDVNSLQNSLITMEVMDEVRRQLNVVYPADNAQ